jgi:cell division septum initiation protein DivIVA
VDVHDKLDELTALVENARSMPMSASCVVNRGEVLGLLEELRELLPEEFRHAEMLLHDREAVVDEGSREASRILEEARAEQARLVSQTEVLAAAQREADQVRQAAAEEARGMRGEVDDYVDAKLANFEVVLDRTLAAVHRGREKLRGRSSHDEFGADADEGHPLDDDALRG